MVGGWWLVVGGWCMGRWREIGVSKGGKVGRQHDRSDSER